MLGRMADALTRNSWILGVANDPQYKELFSDADLSARALTAYIAWVDNAIHLPPMQVNQLLHVLDQGEWFAAAIGKPTWRAGLVAKRASVLAELDRLAEAIGYAEEAVVLATRDPSMPGLTLSAHRSNLGNILRLAGRFEEARNIYKIVLEDGDSSPHGRFIALRGLVSCCIDAKGTKQARHFAEEGLRLAEPMGDELLCQALEEVTGACLAQGDLGTARDASDRRITIARRLGGADGLFFAFHRAAAVALVAEDGTRARGFFDEAGPHAEALDHARGGTHYQGMLAQLRAVFAKPTTARTDRQ